MAKVLVTGANKGIGYGICKFLGKSGWQVIVGARNSERAEEAMKSLKAEGVDVIGWQYVNLSDNASLEQTAKEVKEKYHDLELLVNNAGHCILCCFAGYVSHWMPVRTYFRWYGYVHNSSFVCRE